MNRDFTALGSITVLVLISTLSVLYLALKRYWRTALVLALSIAGGMALSISLKHGFDRPRPDLVPHIAEVRTASFPSSHSMMATIVFLTIGALLAKSMPERSAKVFVIFVSTFVALGVGVSRVYLGVHWPSDVLAGWAAGSAWALLSWLVLDAVSRFHEPGKTAM